MLITEKKPLHTPVLLNEILSLFPKDKSSGEILDCTFGRGGHSLSFVKEYPGVLVTALDCDRQAIDYGSSLKEVKEGKIRLLKKNFHDFPGSLKKEEKYDMILMDLGVSSPQLDDSHRGFSFSGDGPLDMRMDQDQTLKARDIVNSWSKKDLENLFQSYGEIKNPYKIVGEIFKQRQKKKMESTRELAQLIQKHSPSKIRGLHPATLWFLALRMFVNQELEGLKKCLPEFLPFLKKGGCLAVISFHSLEDRIVKKRFQEFVSEGQGRLLNKKVIRAGKGEIKENPRSRSAKLRVFCKD